MSALAGGNRGLRSKGGGLPLAATVRALQRPGVLRYPLQRGAPPQRPLERHDSLGQSSRLGKRRQLYRPLMCLPASPSSRQGQRLLKGYQAGKNKKGLQRKSCKPLIFWLPIADSNHGHGD